MAITFHFIHPVQLPQRKRIKLLVNNLFQKEGKNLSALDVIFCSDEYLLKINKKFLKHDYYTDIITFDLSEDMEAVTGEIYISVETAKSNAVLFNVLVFNELLRLIIHGSLHLCGYEDNTTERKSIISLKENEYLSQFETV